ncbi:hypothetical protein U91I_02222 [alpha proteobacterium U9-1i]|nr:hypothetical protein U91I_02222 [alpha proteobacterium U9-1i]
MQKAITAAAIAVLVAGCGTAQGERIVSGAGIGAGVGLVGGGPGVVGGALIGAAVGGLVPPSKINLGEPLWK